MRLGVLDVGSNTVHLQIVDTSPGARPNPTFNYKEELKLTQYISCLLYTSPSPRDRQKSRMPSSA